MIASKQVNLGVVYDQTELHEIYGRGGLSNNQHMNSSSKLIEVQKESTLEISWPGLSLSNHSSQQATRSDDGSL